MLLPVHVLCATGAYTLSGPVLEEVVWFLSKNLIQCLQCPEIGVEILVHRANTAPQMIWEALYVDG